MKKILIILAFCIVVLSLCKTNEIVIPKDSIRFRVIANSNSDNDQIIKRQVVQNLKVKLEDLSFKEQNLQQFRNVIKKEIPLFENVVKTTLNQTEYKDNYNINYGLNYFPKKEYKGIVYEEGNYESLVITIGDGLGENFWCILFPPLCQIDDNKTSNIEYKSLIKEILNKYI